MDSFRRPDWCSLPELAVVEVATHLNPIQFIAFRGVCKTWRRVCIENKAVIIAKMPPLLLCLSCSRFAEDNLPRTSPACQLYSFLDNTSYVSHLPPEFYDLDDYDHLLGYSHGYIITRDRMPKAIFFSNPFTGDRFSVPFWPYGGVQCVLSDSPRSPSCDVVVFLEYGVVYHCRLCHGEQCLLWSASSFSDMFQENPRAVPGSTPPKLQALWFKGLLYCIVSHKVFAVELGCTPPKVHNFDFAMAGQASHNPTFPPCLLANESELLLLDLTCVPFAKDPLNRRLIDINQLKCTVNKIKVYRLEDPETGIWKLLDNVEGRTLFGTLCVKQGSGFLPCVAGLAGFEHGWGDRILFTGPFGCLIVNSKEGVLYDENEHPSIAHYRWSKYLFLAWASANRIC